MAVELTMPQLGESVTEGTVERWLKKPGDHVERYEPLVEVNTDKVNVEMMLTETRLPLLGGIVHRVRSGLHELVLFYVNRLASRQIHFNEQTARALVAMVRDLEEEVRDLRARVSSLEASDE